MPAKGASSVPTNTELRVLYFGTLEGYSPDGQGCELPLARMRLIDDAGRAIELDAATEEAGAVEVWMVARSAERLRPQTHYDLEVQVGSAGSDCTCGEAAGWTEVSNFTTGEGDDGAPPTFQGIDRMELSTLVDGSSDCGRTAGFPVEVTFEPADDRSPDVRYDVYVGGQIAARYVASFEYELFVDCGSSALHVATYLSPGARVQVRAVDLAGNASALGPEFVIDADCAAPRGAADGGVGAKGAADAGASTGSGDHEMHAPSSPAAGAGDTAGNDGETHAPPPEPATSVTAGGCAVSQSHASPALIGWFAALAVAWMRRRRAKIYRAGAQPG